MRSTQDCVGARVVGMGREDLRGFYCTKNRPIVRRGEGGWERWGGPLWTQSGGLCGPGVGRLAPQRLS